MGKMLVSLIFLSIFSTGPALAADLSSYGDLYLIEEKKEISEKSYELGLSTGVVSNHPVFNVETIGLAFRKRWNLNFRSGLKYLYNNAHENTSTELINNQLAKESKNIRSDYPKNMLLAELDFLAFIGHVNFLELKKLSTNSGFGVELGRTLGYQKDVVVINPKYIFELEMTKDVFAGIFIGQRFFLNQDAETFTELGLTFTIRM